MSVCLSACVSVLLSVWLPVLLHGKTRLSLDGFSWNLVLNNFRKFVEKFNCYENLARITGISLEDLFTFMIISRWTILKMRNVSDKICRENQNTHFIFYNFSRKSCSVWDDVEKYFSARRTADDNITRLMCVQCWITKAANTLGICNIYCFSTSIIFARTHPNVTLIRCSLFNLQVHAFSDCQKEKNDFEIHQSTLPILPPK
jgi:hypothetical protein